jgi:hypothetical protein
MKLIKLNFTLTLGLSGNFLVFDTCMEFEMSSHCENVFHSLPKSSQSGKNSNPCELSKIRAYFKIEKSCPIELMSL